MSKYFARFFYEDFAKEFCDYLGKRNIENSYEKKKDEYGNVTYLVTFFIDEESMPMDEQMQIRKDIQNLFLLPDKKKSNEEMKSKSTISDSAYDDLIMILYEICTDIIKAYADETSAKMSIDDSIFEFDRNANEMTNKFLQSWFKFDFSGLDIHPDKAEKQENDLKYMMLKDLSMSLKSKIVDSEEYVFRFTSTSCTISHERDKAYEKRIHDVKTR